MKGDVIPVLRNLNHWPRFRLRLFVEGGIVGILSGSIISFFRWALESGTVLRQYVYDTILIEGNLIHNLLWFLI